jgi:hypothetical protein
VLRDRTRVRRFSWGKNATNLLKDSEMPLPGRPSSLLNRKTNPIHLKRLFQFSKFVKGEIVIEMRRTSNEEGLGLEHITPTIVLWYSLDSAIIASRVIRSVCFIWLLGFSVWWLVRVLTSGALEENVTKRISPPEEEMKIDVVDRPRRFSHTSKLQKRSQSVIEPEIISNNFFQPPRIQRAVSWVDAGGVQHGGDKSRLLSLGVSDSGIVGMPLSSMVEYDNENSSGAFFFFFFVNLCVCFI